MSPEPCLLVVLPGLNFTVVSAEDWPRLWDVAWGAMTPGRRQSYVRGVVDGRKVLLHRLIMGEPEGLPVDHRDGDGLNNSRGNLRACTHSENRLNVHKGRRRLPCGELPDEVMIVGIVRPGQRWCA